MTSIQLTALPDGPYRLKGDVTILDRDGRPLPERGSPVYLSPLRPLGRQAVLRRLARADGWKEDA